MPPTSGSHCLAVGCSHDSAHAAALAHPAPSRGRRVRRGKHARTADTAETGRRSA
jgi:hypothetical protein